MVLMAVRSRLACAKCVRTFRSARDVKVASSEVGVFLTNINPRTALCGYHQVLELLEIESFPWHVRHCMVKHLTCCVRILDFVTRKGQE